MDEPVIKDKEYLYVNNKFHIPRRINIINQWFNVELDKEIGGAFFDTKDSKLVIGSRDLDISPEYTFSILIHEISEIIHCNILNTRYADFGTAQDYKFFMTHKEFESHNAILTGIIYDQILRI